MGDPVGMRGEHGREGSKGLRASFCLRVGSCGSLSLGGDCSVALADLVRWGDWGASPIGSSLCAWPFSLQTCAVPPGECAWVCDLVTLGSDSYFATDWLGELG